jgi:hypothetical protein
VPPKAVVDPRIHPSGSFRPRHYQATLTRGGGVFLLNLRLCRIIEIGVDRGREILWVSVGSRVMIEGGVRGLIILQGETVIGISRGIIGILCRGERRLMFPKSVPRSRTFEMSKCVRRSLNFESHRPNRQRKGQPKRFEHQPRNHYPREQSK